MNITIFAMTVFQLRTFKTHIMTNTRALVDHKLYVSVAERIKHKAVSSPACREKSSNPWEADFL